MPQQGKSFIEKILSLKITLTQQSLEKDAEDHLEVDESWSWNILWSEVSFILNGTSNNQSCYIWDFKNRHMI